MSAKVEGFSLHANVAVHADDRPRLERLARYCARPPIAMERLDMRPTKPSGLSRDVNVLRAREYPASGSRPVTNHTILPRTHFSQHNCHSVSAVFHAEKSYFCILLRASQ